MDQFVIATKQMRVDDGGGGGDLRTQDRVMTDLENEDESEDEEGAVIGKALEPAASASAPSLTQDSETGGNIPENVEKEAGSQGSASPSAVTAMTGILVALWI